MDLMNSRRVVRRRVSNRRHTAVESRFVALVVSLLLACGVLSVGGIPAAAATGYSIETFAGQPTMYGWNGDGGQATSAEMMYPRAVSGDGLGTLYVGDSNAHVVRKIDPSGIITTIAGDGTSGDSGDGGPATSAQLDYVTGVAVDAVGNVYVSDAASHRVRKVAAGSGTITTIAGTGAWGYTGDGGPAVAAQIFSPQDLAIGPDGDLYFATRWTATVRKVDLGSGIITTVAGNGSTGFSGDGGLATSAQLDSPIGVNFDKAGNLYIADRANHRIRKVAAGTGIITTVAGTGVAGAAGNGGPAVSAQINAPEGVAVSGDGKIFISEMQSHRMRIVDPTTGNIDHFAGTGSPGFAGNGTAATTAQLNEPFGLWAGPGFDLYIADPGNKVIRRAYRVDTNSIDLDVTIKPVLSLSAAAHAGSCNGVAQSSTSSSGPTSVHLGGISGGANGVVAQDFRVITNASNGYSMFIRHTGPLTGPSGTLTDLAAPNSAPTAFPASGTEAVGYTTSDSALSGTPDRFTNGGAKWAGFSVVNEQVGRSVSGYVDKTICLAYQAGVSDATLAGSYTSSVLITVVPSF
jgi:sugar lactone lactonase YvrE